METRKCTYCKTSKSLDGFYKLKTGLYSGRCKECEKLRRREYYAKWGEKPKFQARTA
jgi:hypothetical protein